MPDERLGFVVACLESQDSMAALCRRFGISRRVGYKWLSRYKESGAAGLAQRSRAPHASPHRVAEEVERRIDLGVLDARRGRMLRARERRHLEPIRAW